MSQWRCMKWNHDKRIFDADEEKEKEKEKEKKQMGQTGERGETTRWNGS